MKIKVKFKPPGNPIRNGFIAENMNEFQHKGKNKKQFVQSMFDDISPQYDFLNHLLSFGVDLYWRNMLVNSLPLTDSMIILDVATGTGDVGFAILKKADVKIIGLDYAFKMAETGHHKSSKKGYSKQFTFIQGDAESLPIADDSVDILTISYGFRNIGHYDKAMAEFYRVLKPGGMCAVLEFQTPHSQLFGKLFTFYFKYMLPRIGALFSRSDAYRYLPESVQNFLNRGEMIKLMQKSGFKQTEYRDMTFGISSLFKGVK